jgi:nitrite reductase/ring-hydroxylating ferredoxin subunit
MKLFKKVKVLKPLLPASEQSLIKEGEIRELNWEGKELCLVKRKGNIHVFDNACPHNGFSLSKGWCSDDDAIVCPLHRFRFDLVTGRAKSGIATAVRVYPVKEKDGALFIEIEKWEFALFD